MDFHFRNFSPSRSWKISSPLWSDVNRCCVNNTRDFLIVRVTETHRPPRFYSTIFRNCFSNARSRRKPRSSVRYLLTTSFIAGSSVNPRVILFFFLSSVLSPFSFCWNFDATDEEKAIWSVILNAVPALRLIAIRFLRTRSVSLIGPISK